MKEEDLFSFAGMNDLNSEKNVIHQFRRILQRKVQDGVPRAEFHSAVVFH